MAYIEGYPLFSERNGAAFVALDGRLWVLTWSSSSRSNWAELVAGQSGFDRRMKAYGNFERPHLLKAALVSGATVTPLMDGAL